jgi:hypothetical protein
MLCRSVPGTQLGLGSLLSHMNTAGHVLCFIFFSFFFFFFSRTQSCVIVPVLFYINWLYIYSLIKSQTFLFEHLHSLRLEYLLIFFGTWRWWKIKIPQIKEMIRQVYESWFMIYIYKKKNLDSSSKAWIVIFHIMQDFREFYTSTYMYQDW